MRLYAPKPAALDGTWNPPAIKRVKRAATAKKTNVKRGNGRPLPTDMTTAHGKGGIR
jgi:hypothetical protein